MVSTKPTLTPEMMAERHRKQVRLQIWLPIGVAILLVLAVAVIAVLGTVYRSSEINRWGSISAILLIIPNLLTSLISMAILFLSVKGLAILYRKIPGWIQRLFNIFQKIQMAVRMVANKLAAPVFAAHRTTAGIQAVRHKFTRKKQSRSS